MFKSVLLVAVAIVSTSSQSCCPTKVVAGQDSLAGTYNLYDGPANFLSVCQ